MQKNNGKHQGLNDCGLVSIITPAYNCASYIEETINSVLAQTYQHWEMIIVDDCSADDTEQIVMRYKATDSRISYLKNERNVGAALSRNRALREARGRWVAFLDGDDTWSAQKLEKQIGFMVDNGYLFSYHVYEEMDGNSVSTGTVVSAPKCVGYWKMVICCWPGCLTVMYDREKIGLIQVDDIKKNNDLPMWFEITKQTDGFFLPLNLARYRRHSDSITPEGYLQKIKWHYRMLRVYCKGNRLKASAYLLISLPGNVVKKLFYVKRMRK